AEAKVMVSDWREDYNERRPHSALQMMAPARFARAWAQAVKEGKVIPITDAAKALRSTENSSSSTPRSENVPHSPPGAAGDAPAAPRRPGDPAASGPLRAGATGSPVSLRDLLQPLDLHLLVRDDPLERRVLALEFLQALDVVRLHPAVLRAPAVERVLGDFELLGDLGDRLAFRQQPLGLAQLANDLL